jgi:magnesium transporter
MSPEKATTGKMKPEGRAARRTGRARRKSVHGLPPGTAVFVGEKKTEVTRITILDYNETSFEERTVRAIDECFACRDSPTVSWINVDGIHDVEAVGKLAGKFDIHPLTVEDTVNTQQRPKMEEYDDYVFFVLKMILHDEKTGEIETEQVSLVLGKNYVISFQEKEGDIFDAVRERIRSGKGRIRKMSADYLVYSLIDAVVDHYFVILEKTGERVEELEDRVVSDPRPETLNEIHRLKRDMIHLRRSVWPLREVINGLERGESRLIGKATRLFLRDVYDHTIQVIDTVETFRDMLSGLHDTYLSSISNRMNEIMKVLTVIATIFIPLTFIAGVYGMNFKFMPELGWRWAYFGVWGVMAAVAAGMVVYFKRKKWF